MSHCKSVQLSLATWKHCFPPCIHCGARAYYAEDNVSNLHTNLGAALNSHNRRRVQECLPQEEDNVEMKRRLNLFGYVNLLVSLNDHCK